MVGGRALDLMCDNSLSAGRVTVHGAIVGHEAVEQVCRGEAEHGARDEPEGGERGESTRSCVYYSCTDGAADEKGGIDG